MSRVRVPSPARMKRGIGGDLPSDSPFSRPCDRMIFSRSLWRSIDTHKNITDDLICLAADQLANAGDDSAPFPGLGVRIQIHRDRCLGVAQEFAQCFQVGAGGEGERHEGMPDVMYPNG